MPAKSKTQSSAFGMALAARRGDIEPDALTGAAKLLFKDPTLTEEQLGDYARNREAKPEKAFGRPRKTFKRG